MNDILINSQLELHRLKDKSYSFHIDLSVFWRSDKLIFNQRASSGRFNKRNYFNFLFLFFFNLIIEFSIIL